MTVLEIFNLIASTFSIVTGVVALVLALVFFFSAKKAERNTDEAMVKISEATNTLGVLSMRLLNKLTTALVAPRPTDEKLTDILIALNSDGKLKDGGEPNNANKAALEQFRIDNLITAYYYCAMTNISLQAMLPTTIEETLSIPDITNLVEQTRTDCNTMKNWLDVTQDIEGKIDHSPVKHLYDQVLNIEASIQTVSQHYANKTN